MFSHAALIVSLSLASVSSVAAADISGTVTTTTWIAANSPYRVVGNAIDNLGSNI